MDELKLLLQMVRELPNTALWVLVLIFAYKVSVVGSIYGVIRFTVDRLHSWATTPKHTLTRTTEEIDGRLEGMTITGHVDGLIRQVLRVRGKGTGIDSKYIHAASIEWLREAIDAKETADAVEAATKATHRAALEVKRSAHEVAR